MKRRLRAVIAAAAVSVVVIALGAGVIAYRVLGLGWRSPQHWGVLRMSTERLSEAEIAEFAAGGPVFRDSAGVMTYRDESANPEGPYIEVAFVMLDENGHAGACYVEEIDIGHQDSTWEVAYPVEGSVLRIVVGPEQSDASLVREKTYVVSGPELLEARFTVPEDLEAGQVHRIDLLILDKQLEAD